MLEVKVLWGKKKRKRADKEGGEMKQEEGPVVNTAVRKTQ